MTLISDDPSWWPTIDSHRFFSYFVVGSLTTVVYDWALTFGQEVELIWRQRWSLMTILYFSVRCVGILHAVIMMSVFLPSLLVTDIGCTTLVQAQLWMGFIMNCMLGVIMITRLYTMYGQSRKMLIFLVMTFVAIKVACRVNVAIGLGSAPGEEYILSGIHSCITKGDNRILTVNTWILSTLWEVLALCLALWIAVKHLRELRQSSAGLSIKSSYEVLLRTHVFYFIAFAIVSCFILGSLAPNISRSSSSVGVTIYYSIYQFAASVQMCVLGPRLILDVRECYPKHMANPGEGTTVPSMAFAGYIQR